MVLGLAAQHMDFTKEEGYPYRKDCAAKTVEINKKAFEIDITFSS